MKTFVALNADTQKEERFFQSNQAYYLPWTVQRETVKLQRKKSKEIIENTMKMNKIKNRKTMIRDKRKDSSLKS